MKIIEPKVVHDFYHGVLSGEPVAHYKKYLKDIGDAYQNPPCGEDNDTLMYEVYSYENGDNSSSGSLNWGLTVMYPVCVGEECNLTRGHIHENTACSEIYFGLGGEGLLLLMDREGNAWAEKVYPNSVHYIDGSLAHRLVNTGDEIFRVGACWSGAAGHDYQWVENHPFPARVYKKNGEIVCI